MPLKDLLVGLLTSLFQGLQLLLSVLEASLPAVNSLLMVPLRVVIYTRFFSV